MISLRVLFLTFSISLILGMLYGCKNQSQTTTQNRTVIFADKVGFVGDGKTDNSDVFDKLLTNRESLNLTFGANKKYVFANIKLEGLKEVVINGNGSTFTPPNGKVSKHIISAIDLRSITIKNCTFSSANNKKALSSYAVFVAATKVNVSDLVRLENVKIKNTGHGGLAVRGQSDGYEVVPGAGVNKIEVTNCDFFDFGRNSAYFFNGAHNEITVTNCKASDPLGAQKVGAIWAFSAPLDRGDFQIGKVRMRNCKARYTSKKTVFVQKVKDAEVKDVTTFFAGRNEKGDTRSLTVMKVDDLGKGNVVVFRNIKAIDSGIRKGNMFLSFESTPNIENGETAGVKVYGFESDLLLRLGGSGKHEIIGGLLKDSHISLFSSGNIIQGVSFVNEKLGRTVVVGEQNNIVRNCTFVNATLEINSIATNAKIENCELLNTTGPHFIVIDRGGSEKIVSIEILNCSAPEKVGIVASGTKEAKKKIHLVISGQKQLLIMRNQSKSYGKVDIRKN